MTETLLLVGGGKMGAALLGGWIDRGYDAAAITVVELFAETAKNIAKQYGVTVVGSADALAVGLEPATVVFAVKPQSMDDTVPAYASFAGGDTVFLSIAAGKTIAYFEGNLGPGAAIVRAMSNTPAAVGRGISVACANGRTAQDQKNRCHELLEAVGEVAWIDDEGLMDAVTAVSGSGPAYVFLLAECLAQAGIEAGLAPDLSERLARATVAGSGEMLHQAEEAASGLRANVISPGGTTAAALEILMGENGLQELMTKAVEAAAKRSRELAG
ncbi:MAG: pyrroline-5-carboxylate reductase [Rhodospirillales bacterium]|nr:pyrroline-5-carboxylate reductase [Rhodospirillales bacterium]